MTTSPTDVETTMAYLMLLNERDESETVDKWITDNLVANSFEEGASHFFMMADGSIVIFTELADDNINAVVFATPSSMRHALGRNGPEFADVDPKMMAELSRLNTMIERVVQLLDPARHGPEIGHA